MELGVGGATRVAPPQVSPRPILQTAVWSTWKPAGTRKTSVILFVDSRFINDSDEFGKMFVAYIALVHAFKKN